MFQGALCPGTFKYGDVTCQRGLHLLQVYCLAIPEYTKGEVCVHRAYLSPCMNGCALDGVNSADAAGVNGGGMNVDGARGMVVRGANLD